MLQSAGTPLAALNKRQVSNGVAAGPSNSSRTYKVSNGVAAGPSNSSRTYNATAATLPAALNKGSHARGDIAEEETRSVASDRRHNNWIRIVTSTQHPNEKQSNLHRPEWQCGCHQQLAAQYWESYH
jgi:hypothetical protein